MDLARASGATVEDADKHLLNQLADNRPHQAGPSPAAPPNKCHHASGFYNYDVIPPPPRNRIIWASGIRLAWQVYRKGL